MLSYLAERGYHEQGGAQPGCSLYKQFFIEGAIGLLPKEKGQCPDSLLFCRRIYGKVAAGIAVKRQV
jgi:hypothetical protein